MHDRISQVVVLDINHDTSTFLLCKALETLEYIKKKMHSDFVNGQDSNRMWKHDQWWGSAMETVNVCDSSSHAWLMSDLWTHYDTANHFSIEITQLRDDWPLPLYLQIHRYVTVLGPWTWEETNFLHIGVRCDEYSVQPGGGALHQPEGHICQSGPAPPLPRPNRFCRWIWFVRCCWWRLSLELIGQQFWYLLKGGPCWQDSD